MTVTEKIENLIKTNKIILFMKGTPDSPQCGFSSKIIGIFTRLWKRDGKPRYPTLCPRVWRYLEADLAAPVLAPVKAWFDAHIPVAKRGDPMLIAVQ
jgi:hypothetical protein